MSKQELIELSQLSSVVGCGSPLVREPIPAEQAIELSRAFKAMMSIHEQVLDGNGSSPSSGSGEPVEPPVEVKLGDLEALRGVVKFPVRIKCATLCWNTLLQGLDEAADA